MQNKTLSKPITITITLTLAASVLTSVIVYLTNQNLIDSGHYTNADGFWEMAQIAFWIQTAVVCAISIPLAVWMAPKEKMLLAVILAVVLPVIIGVVAAIVAYIAVFFVLLKIYNA
ncbi:MAG: hypothetical protein IJR00_07275 [Lachnospiraceae bacterium]|nr:hypothetical protein [Lachnospiraceae bacterium]